MMQDLLNSMQLLADLAVRPHGTAQIARFVNKPEARGGGGRRLSRHICIA